MEKFIVENYKNLAKDLLNEINNKLIEDDLHDTTSAWYIINDKLKVSLTFEVKEID